MEKLTEWYPPEIKPARIGWYESLPPTLVESYDYYPRRFWDSQSWCYQPARPVGSTLPPTLVPCTNQKRAWRGLTQDPTTRARAVQVGVPGNPFWSIE